MKCTNCNHGKQKHTNKLRTKEGLLTKVDLGKCIWQDCSCLDFQEA